MSHDAQVIILGAGPVGLAAATLLASEGVQVAVIDRVRIPAHHPRASHVDDETVRIMQALGLAHLEPDFVHYDSGSCYRIYDAHDRVVMEMPWGQLTEQGWWGDNQFFQPDVENTLRGRLQTGPTVTTWFGWEVELAEQDERGVTVAIRNVRTGDRRQLTADYLIAADGVRSRGRALIGGEIENFNASHRSLILDVFELVPSDKVHETFTRATAPNAVTCVPSARGIVRFEFMLTDADDVSDFEKPERWYELLTPFYKPGDYRVERADVYSWDAVVPEEWRKGRVMIAGDAAHEMPPHMGQGMCSGLRDAINLAWKLALAVKGEAPETLLDTYATERRPHARAYTQAAGAAANAVAYLTAFPGDPNEPLPAAHVDLPEPRLGPGLHDGEPAPAGALSIQPVLADGRRLDDVVGYKFAVIGDADVIAAVTDATKAAWQRLGAVVLTEYPAQLHAWLDARGAKAEVVRPDRYLLGLAKDSADLDRLTKAIGLRDDRIPSAMAAG